MSCLGRTPQVLCLGIVGQDCGVTHVVVPGDTCFAIANKVGITLDVLLANNPNVNDGCTNLGVGEVSFGTGTASREVSADRVAAGSLCR